jgi:shikimate kinase
MTPAVAAALDAVLEAVDPRLRVVLRQALQVALSRTVPPLSPERRWVLGGHRAAGKSSVLRAAAALCPRPGVDLDGALARRAGRPLRAWLTQDPAGFRAAERQTFAALPLDSLVAVGGGFLSLHADLLGDSEVILVPITFETYRERLLGDTTRPRLRPHLSLEDELREVFEEREAAHARVPTRPLPEALAAWAALAETQRGET